MRSLICPNCGKEVPVEKIEYGFLAACCNMVLYFRPDMRRTSFEDPSRYNEPGKKGEGLE